MVADPGADAGGERAPLYHGVGIGLGKGGSCELPVAAPDRPEKPSLWVLADPGFIKVGVQVDLERMMAGHLVPLAVFLPQPNPEAPILNENVLHAHRSRRPDARKAENHKPDQRPITQPNRRADVDAVEQLAGLERVEHGRPPLAHAVGGPADRGGRVERHDLPGDEPVEQVSEGGQAQLGGRRRVLAGLQLDPRGDMQRLHIDDRRDVLVGAPGEEVSDRTSVGAPRVRVADGRREELEEADAGALTSFRDERRNGRRANEREGGHEALGTAGAIVLRRKNLL